MKTHSPPPEAAPPAEPAYEIEVTFTAAADDIAALTAYSQRIKKSPTEILRMFTREWAAMARRIYKI